MPTILTHKPTCTCEKCRPDFGRLDENVRLKSMTMCHKCAFKFRLSIILEQAEHRVLAGQGPDSLCDFCNEENGGAVIYISA